MRCRSWLDVIGEQVDPSGRPPAEHVLISALEVAAEERLAVVLEVVARRRPQPEQVAAGAVARAADVGRPRRVARLALALPVAGVHADAQRAAEVVVQRAAVAVGVALRAPPEGVVPEPRSSDRPQPLAGREVRGDVGVRVAGAPGPVLRDGGLHRPVAVAVPLRRACASAPSSRRCRRSAPARLSGATSNHVGVPPNVQLRPVRAVDARRALLLDPVRVRVEVLELVQAHPDRRSAARAGCCGRARRGRGVRCCASAAPTPSGHARRLEMSSRCPESKCVRAGRPSRRCRTSSPRRRANEPRIAVQHVGVVRDCGTRLRVRVEVDEPVVDVRDVDGGVAEALRGQRVDG